MKTVSPNLINKQINKCYLDYDKGWPNVKDQNRVHGFKYHIEQVAGLKLDFVGKIGRDGRFGYELNNVEIIDEPTFTMWLLKWS